MKITIEDVKFHAVGMAKFLGFYGAVLFAGYWLFMFGVNAGLVVREAFGPWFWPSYLTGLGVFMYILFRPKRESMSNP
jgi:hypothetical protein